MIGLREHARDAGLTERFGEFPVLSEAEVIVLVSQHLACDGARARAARWNYARWKPRTALTMGFEVELENGAKEHVTAKLHAGSKLGAPRPYEELGGPLRAFCAFESLGLTLSSFPFDRELPGLQRCHDLRRVARHVDELGLFLPLRMRPGPSRVELLRYKPERRAVLRLDLRLRERDDGPRAARRLILRVHPPAVAERIASVRAALDAGSAGLTPRLEGCEARTGVLFEEFLEVVPHLPDRFDHAELAGALLARLHAAPCPLAPPAARRESFAEWCPIVPEFSEADAWFDGTTGGGRSWQHGDFHPDQVAEEHGGGARLLDLDALTVGDPCEDLASWIADHVAQTGIDWRAAAAPLLAGYAQGGGRAPEQGALARAVARALVRSAAGALRRLEAGALELAQRRLAAARAAAGDGERSVVVERIERSRSGARWVTEREGTCRRWFEERAGERAELGPRRDVELRLSSWMAELEGTGAVEVLAYRPGRRLTLRYVAEDGRRAILKGYRRGREVEALRRAALAHAALRGARTRAADVLRHDAERATLWFEDLGGAPLALGALEPRRLRDFAADLRHFQACAEASALPLHTAAGELAVIDELAERVRGLGCAIPAEFDEARAGLGRALGQVPASAPVLAQRDLHDGQLLDLGERFGWIDFDLGCRADDALDAANLAAHLELRLLQGVPGLDRERVAEARAALLDGLGRALEPGFGSRLRWYEAASFLRLALVYAQRPPWAALSSALAERARLGAGSACA